MIPYRQKRAKCVERALWMQGGYTPGCKQKRAAIWEELEEARCELAKARAESKAFQSVAKNEADILKNRYAIFLEVIVWVMQWVRLLCPAGHLCAALCCAVLCAYAQGTCSPC